MTAHHFKAIIFKFYLTIAYPYLTIAYPYLTIAYPYLTIVYPYLTIAYPYLTIAYPYLTTSVFVFSLVTLPLRKILLGSKAQVPNQFDHSIII